MAAQTSLKTLSDFANILLGTQVVVEDEEGKLYTGILRDVTNELMVELSFVQLLPISEESKFILSRKNATKTKKMKVTRLSGDFCGKVREKVFLMDGEIGINGDDYESDKEFTQWKDDDIDDEYGDEVPCDLDEKESKNRKWKKPKKTAGWWSVDEMFRANKDKCIGESSFDENLTQYSNVEIGQRTLEEKRRAEELARQIEMNPISRRNALLENDDEERDLDALTRFKEEETKLEKKNDDEANQSNAEVEIANNVDVEDSVEVEEHKQEEEIKIEKLEKDEVQENENSLLLEKQTKEENKTKFTFNPKAIPFVPKQKDLNSNPSPTVNAFNNNLPSQFQTFVQVPAVQIPPNVQISQIMPPTNLVYNNPIVYPQQQQMPPVPLYDYAYAPTSLPPPSSVYSSVQTPQQGPLYTAPNPQAMIVSTPPQNLQPQSQVIYPQPVAPPTAIPIVYPQQQQMPPVPLYAYAYGPTNLPPPSSVYSSVQMPQQGKPLYTAANQSAMIASTPPQNVQQQSQVIYPQPAVPPTAMPQLPSYNVNVPYMVAPAIAQIPPNPAAMQQSYMNKLNNYQRYM